MIVVDIQLHSAITREVSSLGKMVIDNTGGTHSRGNYRCRMFKKSNKTIYEQAAKERPFREAVVMNHARLAEPVHNLVAKALKAMGYE